VLSLNASCSLIWHLPCLNTCSFDCVGACRCPGGIRFGFKSKPSSEFVVADLAFLIRIQLKSYQFFNWVIYYLLVQEGVQLHVLATVASCA
jgi:hypothetical protein